MALKEHTAGPKFRFKTPDELQNAVDDYFETCDGKTIAVFAKQLSKSGDPVTMHVSTPYTVEGLAEHLGTTRETIHDYQHREDSEFGEAFQDIINTAKQKITRHKIERGLIGAYDSRFAMFDLINNSGYKNEKAVDHTSGGQPITKIVVE